MTEPLPRRVERSAAASPIGARRAARVLRVGFLASAANEATQQIIVGSPAADRPCEEPGVGAQISRICTAAGLPGLDCAATHIGGYFAAREALHSVQPSPGLTARRRVQSHGP